MSGQIVDFRQAITRYQGFLQQDPNNALLLISLGDLHHQSGDFAQATAHYQRCIEQDPRHRVARGRLASVMISEHRFEDAERLLRELLAAGEIDGALLHNLGLCIYYQRRWAEALDVFRQARDSGVVGPEVVRYQAYAMHHLGDVEHAIELCEQWLAKTPEDVRMNGYLSLLQMDKGDMSAASQRAEEVLKNQPDNPDAALVASMWRIEQQEIDLAQQHAETVLRAEPESPRGWFAKGLVHMYRQEHAEAISAIEAALKQMPGHVGTIVTLAWAKFAARDLHGAEATFRQAIAADGTFAEGHGGLAVTLLMQNRREEARREEQIARRLSPDSLGAVWARGALLALDGKKEAGEVLVAAALQRPLTADGRTMLDHIQQFARQQAARGNGAPKKSQ